MGNCMTNTDDEHNEDNNKIKTTIANINIDVNVFKDNKNGNKCGKHNDNPIEACKAVKRLVLALKYYSSLALITNTDDQNTFAHFIANIYKIYLDDYCHLVQKHKNLEDINKAMMEMKEFGGCDILKCLFSARHHTDDKKKK
eukprot:201373_1